MTGTDARSQRERNSPGKPDFIRSTKTYTHLRRLRRIKHPLDVRKLRARRPRLSVRLLDPVDPPPVGPRRPFPITRNAPRRQVLEHGRGRLVRVGDVRADDAGGVAGYAEGTSWADWRRIEGVEKANARNGAPRAKFADVEAMLDAASSS